MVWHFSAPSAAAAPRGGKGPKSPVMRNLLRQLNLRPKLVPFVRHTTSDVTDARSTRTSEQPARRAVLRVGQPQPPSAYRTRHFTSPTRKRRPTAPFRRK